MDQTGSLFGAGRINVGEIELTQVSTFELKWSSNEHGRRSVGFYKPVHPPEGFHALGYKAMLLPNEGNQLEGWIVAAKAIIPLSSEALSEDATDGQIESLPLDVKRLHPQLPALARPLDYALVWSNALQSKKGKDGGGSFWLPVAPAGYKALGYVVTSSHDKPSVDAEVMCVRADLTEEAVVDTYIWIADHASIKYPFKVGSTKPRSVGIHERGIALGTFSCSHFSQDLPAVATLKNVDLNLQAMPNLDQVHSLLKKYAPTVFFHSQEVYFPASVKWFFDHGALLCSRGSSQPVRINSDGSNLPSGGTNDEEFWIDLPSDGAEAELVKHGDLESAEAYVQVKPMLGGTATDLVFWLYYPFNGPGTVKINRLREQSMGSVGEHVSDWEHFTLRFNNFTAKLQQLYFSQHSKGSWIMPSDLEYLDDRPVVYSSQHGHACYPHPGVNLQGKTRLGIGLANKTGRSSYMLDTSSKYMIASAEYMGVVEPPWLQFMRAWGPTVEYHSRKKFDSISNKLLPSKMSSLVQKALRKLPPELSRKKGPTGPKLKSSWAGDEK